MGPRTLQVLLGVGAVLVVSAAVAVGAAYGGAVARTALLVLAGVAAGCSVAAARARLRSTEETLAACAGGLAVAGSTWGGTLRVGSAIPLGVVAAVCVGLHLARRTAVGWPLAAWAAAQLAVLRVAGAVPDRWHAALFLAVALVGLGTALAGRRLVAVVALVTSAPWWLLGVLAGSVTAWTGTTAERLVTALLLVAACAALVVVRLDRRLDPLLGAPGTVPVIAGIAAGGAVAGAAAGFGPSGVTLAGYAGVHLAFTVPDVVRGRAAGLIGRTGRSAGGTLAVAALLQLPTGQHWGWLIALLLATAVPTALVAARWESERRTAVPTVVGCLTGAVLCAVPAGWFGPGVAAALLTGLYGAGLAVALLLRDARRPTVVASGIAACGALLLVGGGGDHSALALALAVQGLLTVGWARVSARPATERPASRAWRVGAAQLTGGAWLAAAVLGLHRVEVYTLPAAAALLLASGPRLAAGPSWPAWGPGLLVAAVPSAVLAVLAPGNTRPVLVLAAAALAMVAAGAGGVRAPLLVGAWTAVGVGLGLSVGALLWPVTATLAIGAVLLGIGARRERSRAGGFRLRLAELR